MKGGFNVKVGDPEPAFKPVAVLRPEQPRLRSAEGQVEDMLESFVVVFEEIDATYHELCRRTIEEFILGHTNGDEFVQAIGLLNNERLSAKEALREVSTFISQP